MPIELTNIVAMFDECIQFYLQFQINSCSSATREGRSDRSTGRGALSMICSKGVAEVRMEVSKFYINLIALLNGEISSLHEHFN